jgi:hypothetical protein
MVARARRKLLGRFRQGVYHCTARCVRQMFLCGWDPLTGRDYSYRRGWIIGREEQLAGLFAIDIEFRAELSTHLHLVLRTLPEVARRWSPREVALRWLTATRLAKSFAQGLPQVDAQLIDDLVKDKKRIERLRRRLANVSWFMGFLCENVARRANAQEDRVGHFWNRPVSCVAPLHWMKLEWAGDFACEAYVSADFRGKGAGVRSDSGGFGRPWPV